MKEKLERMLHENALSDSMEAAKASYNEIIQNNLVVLHEQG